MLLLKNEYKNSNELLSYIEQKYSKRDYFDSIKTIIKIAFEYDLLPTAKTVAAKGNVESYFDWFFDRYLKAYHGRSISRIGNPMGTTPDKIVEHILVKRFGYSLNEVGSIVLAHRQAMLAENIIGNLLEEYIDGVLCDTKWVCCYGETLKYSDFCHPDGQVVQIKNRDNTENSSSKAIRKNTNIKMWFRTFNKTGQTNWDNIYDVFQAKKKFSKYYIEDVLVKFSERGFIDFVTNIITKNPECIYKD